jgi:RNA polymerase sigma factor (sigma-70 family)
MNGTDLLSEFRRERSERAFAELVRRFTNLVYSVARRRTGQDIQAQEVTQLVFIRLARTAPRLRNDSELVAWLHRTTVNASVDLWRADARRRQREEQAVAMNTPTTDPAAWHTLAPALDEALNRLPDGDRETLLRRYFQDESMRDLGAALGISEDAAKMRVSRALDRLREQLSRHGVSCTAVGLGLILTERAIEATPAGFAKSLAAARYPIASAGLIAGFLATLTGTTKWILAASAITALVVGGLALHAVRSNTRPALSAASAMGLDAGPGKSTDGISTAVTDGATNPASAGIVEGAESGDPDPLSLLMRVLQGRQELASGEIQYNLFTTVAKRSGVTETNYLRLKSVFDGSKRLVETAGREYRYTQVGRDASKNADPIIEEQKLDREGAVRAGFLQPFEARYVSLSDGTNWMVYRETDGKPSGTTIDDPAKAGSSSGRFFDFRCLGLSGFLHSETTLESSLGFQHARSIKLLGREAIAGSQAWRVQVVNRYGAKFVFWIDVARPQRVLQCSEGDNLIQSEFDPASPDALPSAVIMRTKYSANHPRLVTSEERYTRVSVRPNIVTDPAQWTLAGLGMPLGTTVVDVRVQRQLGFWDGVGLAISPPPKPNRDGTRGIPVESAAPVDRQALLATLESDPASDDGLSAAEWILLNTPDGPTVEKAVEVVEQHHLASPRLRRLAGELERFRHRATHRLLEGILDRNPDTEIRATACYALATLLKEACHHGKDRKATQQAEQMLERVIREFGHAGALGTNLAYQSGKHLNELRLASVGKPAPETAGPDVDGQTIRLSDFSGRVVVLYFWSGSDYRGSIDNHRALQETVPDKPVIFLGVNCDHEVDKAAERVRNLNLDGPVILDGQSGPLSTAWHIRGWPTVVVVDPAGMIRYRGSYSTELHETLKALTVE